jgi:hypothetical protein
MGPKQSIFGKNFKKFEKPIEKFKIESLVTLLQLTTLVGFLAMAEKNLSTQEIGTTELWMYH